MCIAEQSGICKAGGAAHGHSWASVFEGTIPGAGNRPTVIQLCGLRDDGQRFQQIRELTEDRDTMVRDLRRRLDLELKCCTCLGDEHTKEN